MPPLRAAEIDRDFVTDGVPSSGVHQVRKSDRRAWGTWVEQIIGAFTTNGGLIYSSKPLLDADLAKEANRMAWVYGDPVTADNGIYRKIGASGTGSWARVSDLPFSFIVASDIGAGTANAIVATSQIPISSSGLVLLNIFEANTGSPVTVSFNGGPALRVLSNTGNDIVAGGLQAGMLVAGLVSGATFRIVTDQVSSAIIAAAEAAATLAANKAAEAAESAASVSLPPIAANRMLVDNAAGTARESKTFSQVIDLLQDAAFVLSNNSAYRARALKDRWLDSVRVSDFLNYDPTGATANGHTVLQAAIDAALAASRSEVILPRGKLRFGGAASLVNPVPGAGENKAVRLVGQGDDVSTLQTGAANINVLNVGQSSGAKSGWVTIEGLGFVLGEASTVGAALNVRNINGLKLINCHLGSMPNLMNLGLGASAINDVENVFVINCDGNGQSAGRAAIHIGSGGVLHIVGGKWNGVDAGPMILHSDTTYNWDGLYVNAAMCEQFLRYLSSIGKGVVNVEWKGGQVDRADIAFHAQAASGGSDRNWNITTQILERPVDDSKAGIGILLGGGGGQSEGHTIHGNSFTRMKGHAIWVAAGSASVTGNTLITCGFSGVSNIRWSDGTWGVCVGNFGHKSGTDGALGSATWGTEYFGAGGNRADAGNRFIGMTSGQTTGTP